MSGWLRSALALMKSLLFVPHPGAPADAAIPVSGTIQEIDMGTGATLGTLSGLTAHPSDPTRLYAITDQDSPPLRIVEISVQPGSVPKVVRQIPLQGQGLDSLDPEAIVAKPEGGFWIASEGSKKNTPPNLLLEVDASGTVTRSIGLPDNVATRMPKKGFEGLALADTPSGRHLYAAFQTSLKGDPDDVTRIGDVDLATDTWSFAHYPLDETPGGDITGLSELLYLGDRRFAVIERDSGTGIDAFKRVMTFELTATTAGGSAPPLLEKHNAVDLVGLFAAHGREVEAEVEGLAVTTDGQVYAVTDNDNERPTLLLGLGPSSEVFKR